MYDSSFIPEKLMSNLFKDFDYKLLKEQPKDIPFKGSWDWCPQIEVKNLEQLENVLSICDGNFAGFSLDKKSKIFGEYYILELKNVIIRED